MVSANLLVDLGEDSIIKAEKIFKKKNAKKYCLELSTQEDSCMKLRQWCHSCFIAILTKFLTCSNHIIIS